MVDEYEDVRTGQRCSGVALAVMVLAGQYVVIKRLRGGR
jgi:hypothetical protein